MHLFDYNALYLTLAQTVLLKAKTMLKTTNVHALYGVYKNDQTGLRLALLTKRLDIHFCSFHLHMSGPFLYTNISYI